MNLNERTIAGPRDRFVVRRVVCPKCGAVAMVNFADCIRGGWLRCHDSVMVIAEDGVILVRHQSP